MINGSFDHIEVSIILVKAQKALARKVLKFPLVSDSLKTLDD